MAASPRYAAKKPFVYGGQTLDQGQVVELRGLPNDDRLVKLGFFWEVPRKAQIYTCGLCGAEFLQDYQRTKHGEMRHPDPEDMDEAKAALHEARAKSILEIA